MWESKYESNVHVGRKQMQTLYKKVLRPMHTTRNVPQVALLYFGDLSLYSSKK